MTLIKIEDKIFKIDFYTNLPRDYVIKVKNFVFKLENPIQN